MEKTAGIAPQAAAKLKDVLGRLADVAQELANLTDETGYKLSDAAPNYLSDVDDFAYEITSFIEDELENLNSVEEVSA